MSQDPYLLGILCDGACGEPDCPKCDGKGLAIGNAIEIRAVRRTPYARGPAETWIPATIVNISPSSIGVCFSDSTRLAVQRSGHPRQWRHPE